MKHARSEPDLSLFFHIPFGYLLSDAGQPAWERRENLELYLPASDLDRYGSGDYAEVAKRLKDQRREITVHGPFMDLMPGSPDPQIRKVALNRFTQLFKACSALKPRNIVLHIGYEAIKHKEFFDYWLQNSLLTWREVEAQAADLGLSVSLENIFETDSGPMRRLLDELNSPLFGWCLDVGHFQLFSQEPLAAWLDGLGRYLVEMHLHDNHGAADEHLSPGEGCFDFPALARLLEQRGLQPPYYTLEVHSTAKLDAGIAAIKEYFRKNRKSR